MKKILIITPYLSVSPLRGYETIALEHILSLRRNKAYIIDIISLDRDSSRLIQKIELEKLADNIHIISNNLTTRIINSVIALFKNKPIQFGYFKGNNSDILKNIDSYDLSVTITSRMANLALKIPSKKRILHLVDPLALNYKRKSRREHGLIKLIYQFESNRIINAERELLPKFDVCTLISDSDIMDYQMIFKKTQFQKLKYGVRVFNDDSKETLPYNPNKIVITGNMAYEPNIKGVNWFVKTIFPNIKSQFPNIELFIIGANPNESIRNLANNHIHIKANVPNLLEEVKDAYCTICPISHKIGIQTKILESMRNGIPVISTKIGNEGIQAIKNEEIIIADDPVEFVTALRSLEDENFRNKIINNACKLISKDFDLRKNITTFLKNHI